MLRPYKIEMHPQHHLMVQGELISIVIQIANLSNPRISQQSPATEPVASNKGDSIAVLLAGLRFQYYFCLTAYSMYM